MMVDEMKYKVQRKRECMQRCAIILSLIQVAYMIH
jgi:hypothetical protein